MKEVKIKVYEIHELSKEAKERAYNEWLSETAYYPWGNDNKETLDEFSKLFGVKVIIKDFELCSYSVNFGDDEIRELKGEELRRYLREEYGRYLLSEDDTPKSCPLTGFYLDDYILDPIFEVIYGEKEYENYEDLINECIIRYIDTVNCDIEYYYSMDNFEEECRNNDWYFFKNGVRYEG